MPNIKSAKKRVAVVARKTEINKRRRSELKTVLKNTHQALDSSVDNAAEQAKYAQKKLDQAVGAGLIHKNKASRQKAQIAKKLNQLD
ncbi:MAG: 30S ribosomal protein S20 [Clostridiaceae bacterium]|jgi:small subunit ribosomal protein S20|nr:30S ribosomal protein S20 [Clostridiaceae bacterium]